MSQEDLGSVEDEPRAVGTKARLVARLGRYRDLLARRWWVLAGGFAVGLVAGVVLWMHRPKLFISTGRMIVSIKLAIPEGSVYSEELGNFLGTQAALMKSGVVLNRAQARLLRREPDSAADRVSLKVAVYPKTSIFLLEATGAEANQVQSFCQACMEEYIALKKEMRAQTSDTTVAGLTEEALHLERDLRGCENELTQFQRSNSVVLLQEQGNSLGGYVATLNQRLAALKTEDALLRSITPGEPLGPRQEAGALPLEGAPFTIAGSASAAGQESEVLKARQQIQVLKAQLQDLGRYLRPKHPKMMALSEEIAQRESLLGILIEQNSTDLEGRKAALGRQMAYLEESLAEWNVRALDCSRKMAEYQRLKANQQRVQALYDRLMATLQTLDLNKEISPESVTILEPASPAFPEQHKPLGHFTSAGLLGLALSLVLLLFLDHINDRIKSFGELEEWFQEPVLAQVPLERAARKGAGVCLLDEREKPHAFVEACRSLRSSLLFRESQAQSPRTLLLTSSVPGEGKSLISANLALTMVRANARVLLIDADLRKGVLAERLGVLPEFGLSEVLNDAAPWQESVLATKCPGLFLIPRGTPTSDSGELCLSQAMQKLLREAAAAYDFVILDAAPVMAADDVTSLAPRVDGVLFVLRAERTSARVARAALELLYRRRVNVLGLVFNAVRPTNADYYAYSRYDHYCKVETGSDVE